MRPVPFNLKLTLSPVSPCLLLLLALLLSRRLARHWMRYLRRFNTMFSGHAAMKAIGGGNGETHFTVEITASEFEGKVSQTQAWLAVLLFPTCRCQCLGRVQADPVVHCWSCPLSPAPAFAFAFAFIALSLLPLPARNAASQTRLFSPSDRTQLRPSCSTDQSQKPERSGRGRAGAGARGTRHCCFLFVVHNGDNHCPTRIW